MNKKYLASVITAFIAGCVLTTGMFKLRTKVLKEAPHLIEKAIFGDPKPVSYHKYTPTAGNDGASYYRPRAGSNR